MADEPLPQVFLASWGIVGKLPPFCRSLVPALHG
jgi:hypothetical protein